MLTTVYRIAGNFRGRKLSQIGEKYDFCRENFRGLLAFAVPKDAMPQISRTKLSRKATKPRDSHKFSPSKVFRQDVSVSRSADKDTYRESVVCGCYFCKRAHCTRPEKIRLA